MKTAELREKYLAFFEAKGMKRVPSSSLIPDDPSMLLTSAGMVQFKPYFLQQRRLEAPYIGTTSVQKCVRTTDIDIIGSTGRHLSFFEMLGNFSFGGYFKQEMCAWALEFAIEVLGFDRERLYFTVYFDDDETAAIWRELGVDADRITRLGKEDNFWVAGNTGPCGPSSELYYDQGPEHGCGRPDCAPGCDCDRFLEFWNCVFTQYDMQEDGSLVDLPTKNIDTGLGLERTAALVQGVQSNYDTDILRGLIKVGEELSGTAYQGTFATDEGIQEAAGEKTCAHDLSLRILADHSRAVTFLIGDGILPSNEGRGYVLRRLLRRAIRHGLLLGIETPFLGTYVAAVVAELGSVYPEIVENQRLIERVIHAEEERFATTLRSGQSYLDNHLASALKGAGPVSQLSGAVAFELHDRFGFPIDLTIEIAGEHGVEVDTQAFDKHMQQQRDRARQHAEGDAWSQEGLIYEQIAQDQGPTSFVGYAHQSATAEVVAIVVDGEQVLQISDGQAAEVVLDRTPFYAEKGGQVGDRGTIRVHSGNGDFDDVTRDAVRDTAGDAAGDAHALLAVDENSTSVAGADEGTFEVADTKVFSGIHAHIGHIDGTLRVGDVVCASIDTLRRERIERNHTATHLLHYALQQILGEHIRQAGSLVLPERLRFDFTHFEPLSSEQIDGVEQLVNTLIMEDSTVNSYETTLDAARDDGVTALFGEKYGDSVRVLEAGSNSRELCGGTHVSHTAQVGLMKIISETSIGSSLRRIEAVTSFDALEYLNRRERELCRAAELLKAAPLELADRLEGVLTQQRQLEAELATLRQAQVASSATELLAQAVNVGYQLVVVRLDGNTIGQLRETADILRQGLGANSAVVIGSLRPDGQPVILAAATKQAVQNGFDAGALIAQVSTLIQGSGGGKPQMAQAGGKDPDGLDAALAKTRELLGVEHTRCEAAGAEKLAAKSKQS
ncbi:MAG: alanine--tRNA ligase [Coriobacteriales bacterium]|jgi:alanyl-tRNA synthetase|nr:alanine--tRNA ligase [Coriobacteriales bacterium]